jgi:hypothetical protein
MTLSYFIVLGHAVGAVVGASVFFRRFEMTRPPIGVFNRRDVYIVLGGIVLVPYVYLALPLGAVTVFLVLISLSVVYFALEPVLRARWAIWVTAVGLIGGDVVASHVFGPMSDPFLAVNNVVLIVIVVGVGNLWAQSGMRARDITLLAGALAVYDYIATTQLTLMTDLVHELAHAPLVPFMGWAVQDGGVSVGLGDLLLAGAFPLVLRKAFGVVPAVTAMVVAVATMAGLLAVVQLRLIDEAIPVMLLLGPAMVAQYLFWSRRHPQERTTWQYLQAEPLPRGSMP